MSSSSWLLHRAVINLNVGDCACTSGITCLNPICRDRIVTGCIGCLLQCPMPAFAAAGRILFLHWHKALA